jgi:hypothetical protein
MATSDMAMTASDAILSTRRRNRPPGTRALGRERSQERAMSFFKNLGQYVEITIIVVLAIAALAGIIRFIILADIF